MSFRGISSSGVSYSIIAVIIVRNDLVIDVGYYKNVKLVSVGNKLTGRQQCLHKPFCSIQFKSKNLSSPRKSTNSLFAMKTQQIQPLRRCTSAKVVFLMQILQHQHHSKERRATTSTINPSSRCPRRNGTRSKHNLTIRIRMSHQCCRRSIHHLIRGLPRGRPCHSLNNSV